MDLHEFKGILAYTASFRPGGTTELDLMRKEGREGGRKRGREREGERKREKERETERQREREVQVGFELVTGLSQLPK